ncbi:MAG: CrcB family protein [Oscillospiraceae bacterium]|jgi:CrcB protein|nr:CrcB family protein [Oscillospiraceae bacterium]
MLNLLAILLGGALGAGARYGLGRLLAQTAWPIPASTLLSNALAGLIIGFVLGLEPAGHSLNERTKLFLTTGLMGGLSTFSAFSWETLGLLQDGKVAWAAGNMALNLVLSLGLCAVGMGVARAMYNSQ